MAHRDPMLHFSRQVTSCLTRAMLELSEEGWHDLEVEAGDDSVSVRSKDREANIVLERPPAGMGDFAFPCYQLIPFYESPADNVAFRLFPSIMSEGDLEPPVLAGPYINFQVRPERLVEETLRSVLETDEAWGSGEPRDVTVVLEHTSANPNGPLHVGRARNPIIGDTLARIMRLAGYSVRTHYYLNDMGRQAVLLHWGNSHRDSIGPVGEARKVDHELVHYYQEANRLSEEDEVVEAEVTSIMERLEGGDGPTVSAVREVALRGLAGIQESLERLGIHHDEVVSESSFVLDGSVAEVMETLAASELVVDVDGALAIDMEPFGVHGRNTNFVFRRANGTSLYATRDLAYHLWKWRGADLLVNVLGEDHKLEARQLEHALGLLGSDADIEPVFYAFVSLPEGKMSTRAGRAVYLDDLMDEAVAMAADLTRERRPELDDRSVEAIAEAVGLGAVRYNIVRVQPEKAMVFRWEDALDLEGSSAPFVQYSHTRACSILRRAREEGRPLDAGLEPVEAAGLLTEEAEVSLVSLVARFPGVVRECAQERKAHSLASYAERLASGFNAFYRDVPVLKGDDRRDARLLLVEAVRVTLRNALDTMGIAAPEQM